MAIVAAALDRRAAFFPDERRPWSRARQAVIDAEPSLQERELLKLSALAAAMTRALRQRGVEATAAALAAESGVAVFRLAFAAWIAEGEERSLAELQRAVLAELRTLVARAVGAIVPGAESARRCSLGKEVRRVPRRRVQPAVQRVNPSYRGRPGSGSTAAERVPARRPFSPGARRRAARRRSRRPDRHRGDLLRAPVTSETICVHSPPCVPPPTATSRAARRRRLASPRGCAARRTRCPPARRGRGRPRPWRSVSPAITPRASGSNIGVRSPAKYGSMTSPSAPGRAAAGLLDQRRRTAAAGRARAASR